MIDQGQNTPMQKQAPQPLQDPTAFRIGNPEEFAKNMLRVVEEGGARDERLHRAVGQPVRALLGCERDAPKRPRRSSRSPGSGSTEPAKLAEAQGALLRSYMRAVEHRRPPHAGRKCRACRRAGARRQSLQGPRVVAEPLLRLLEAVVSGHDAAGAKTSSSKPGAGRATRARGRILPAAASSAMSPSNFPLTTRKWCARRLPPTARTSCRAWRSFRMTWSGRAIC